MGYILATTRLMRDIGDSVETKPNADWMLSLERFDNSRGYVKSNCGLICREFQSSDHTLRASVHSRIQGSPQWSAQKFTDMANWLRDPSVRMWISRHAESFAHSQQIHRGEKCEASEHT